MQTDFYDLLSADGDLVGLSQQVLEHKLRLFTGQEIRLLGEVDWGEQVPWNASPIIYTAMGTSQTSHDPKSFLQSVNAQRLIHFDDAGIVKAVYTLRQNGGSISMDNKVLGRFGYLKAYWQDHIISGAVTTDRSDSFIQSLKVHFQAV